MNHTGYRAGGRQRVSKKNRLGAGAEAVLTERLFYLKSWRTDWGRVLACASIAVED
jgi:hypothetical protein